MKRVWKTFQIDASDEAGRLRSVVQNFPHDGYTLRVDSFSGGCVVESDLSLRELRTLFRIAGVRWRDYVTTPSP